jgi:malate synthase
VRYPTKFPWFIDFLNINLDNTDHAEAKKRIDRYIDALVKDGRRITENLDFN